MSTPDTTQPETPAEEPDFLATSTACSLNPDDEGCESCE